MSLSSILLTLLVLPLVGSLVMAVVPAKSASSRHVFEAIHVIVLACVLVMSLTVVFALFVGGETDIWTLGLWFHVDALGAVFVGLIGVIGALTGLYSIPYIAHDVEIGHMSPARVKQFYVFFGLFVFTMLLAATSNNIVLMWVSVEATTLSTVFLVGAYDARLSLEAAWKYVIVCTAGVAFGLYATILIYSNAADIMSNAHEAIFWTSVLPYASQLDGMLVCIAFVFAVIGFGTKAGLFPMHTWLPDAHSEAPSPVSGLLSGVLLKCAMLIIIRFYVLTVQAVGSTFPQTLMMIIGVVSVVVAALAVFAQDDMKRKLAYSSCENVGLIALFLGFGGPLGIAAAILHCITHGFTKALMFCLTGNIMMKYGTRDINKISALIRIMPTTAVLLVIGTFGIAGFPPAAMFISEITGIVGGVIYGNWPVIIIAVIGLTIVVAAFAIMVQKVVFGSAPEGMSKGDATVLALIPEVAFVVLILWFGIAMPAPVLQGVESATAIVMQEPGQDVLHSAPVFDQVFALVENTNTGASK